MAFHENRQGELVYMSSDIIKARHAFTTRYGGVSTGGFSSLNLGSNRGDDPEAVRENYRRCCELMGVGIDDCAATNQVHGNVVRIVTEADKHVCMSKVPYEADGIVTSVKGMPIFCMTADCVPVLLCDEENAVEQMETLGAERSKIRAAIGPAISACCFETDDDVPAAIEKYLSGNTEGLFTRRADGKTMVDLKEANARRLVMLGLKRENIDISDECTMCSHEKYWSHRYTKGQRGSQAAFIVLR